MGYVRLGTSTPAIATTPADRLISAAGDNDFSSWAARSNIQTTTTQFRAPNGALATRAYATGSSSLLAQALLAPDVMVRYSILAHQGSGPLQADLFAIYNMEEGRTIAYAQVNLATGQHVPIPENDVGRRQIDALGGGWYRITLWNDAHQILPGQHIQVYAGFVGNITTVGDFAYIAGAQVTSADAPVTGPGSTRGLKIAAAAAAAYVLLNR